MKFRIYGDNIVECIRVIDLIKANTIEKVNLKLSFNSASSIKAVGNIGKNKVNIVLVPGFDKSDKKRWNENILDNLKQSGGLLDETPDALISTINSKNKESFVCAIEFCSALQAGNQAWQRNGRAYSIGKAHIPYFYIIEYTKYELYSKTRKRKALREPNPIVPYSYLAYSNNIKEPIFQTFFQSEEFDKDDEKFKETDFTTIFSSETVSNFVVSLMLKTDTKKFVSELKTKTKNMVKFLSPDISKVQLSKSNIDNVDLDNFLESIETQTKFSASKKIAKKSSSENIIKLNKLLKKVSKGIFAKNLPFGIIPERNIEEFVTEFAKIYKINKESKEYLLAQKCIIFTLFKGFKPGGDDDRPDRGILPLLRMMFGEDRFIMTIIYGPIIDSNRILLINDKDKLAKKNGLWQTIIYMSNALLVDSVVLYNTNSKKDHITQFINLSKSTFRNDAFKENFDSVDITPVDFREDDVDTLIYMSFKQNCPEAFIGLCNPPGGDWSGYSILKDGAEYRWLSLPRVSANNYKRPDHVIQFTNTNEIFVIESKDNLNDLETNIGDRLKGYIKWLMAFVPSVKKENGKWEKAVNTICASNYKLITAGSYIERGSKINVNKYVKANVDLMFAFKPENGKWDLVIYYKSGIAEFAKRVASIFSKNKIISSTSCSVLPTQI